MKTPRQGERKHGLKLQQPGQPNPYRTSSWSTDGEPKGMEPPWQSKNYKRNQPALVKGVGNACNNSRNKSALAEFVPVSGVALVVGALGLLQISSSDQPRKSIDQRAFGLRFFPSFDYQPTVVASRITMRHHCCVRSVLLLSVLTCCLALASAWRHRQWRHRQSEDYEDTLHSWRPRVVVPTQGEVWPQPLNQTKSSNTLSLDASTFSFQYEGPCFVVQQALKRLPARNIIPKLHKTWNIKRRAIPKFWKSPP
ncbi:hypothetical protein MRX96_008626 [Rhipicephalus microplus]